MKSSVELERLRSGCYQMKLTLRRLGDSRKKLRLGERIAVASESLLHYPRLAAPSPTDDGDWDGRELADLEREEGEERAVSEGLEIDEKEGRKKREGIRLRAESGTNRSRARRLQDLNCSIRTRQC